MLSIIILVCLIFSFRNLAGSLLATVIAVAAFPIIPFVLAYNIRKEKPVIALSLIILWSLVFAITGLLLLLDQI